MFYGQLFFAKAKLWKIGGPSCDTVRRRLLNEGQSAGFRMIWKERRDACQWGGRASFWKLSSLKNFLFEKVKDNVLFEPLKSAIINWSTLARDRDQRNSTTHGTEVMQSLRLWELMVQDLLVAKPVEADYSRDPWAIWKGGAAYYRRWDILRKQLGFAKRSARHGMMSTCSPIWAALTLIAFHIIALSVIFYALKSGCKVPNTEDAVIWWCSFSLILL